MLPTLVVCFGCTIMTFWNLKANKYWICFDVQTTEPFKENDFEVEVKHLIWHYSSCSFSTVTPPVSSTVCIICFHLVFTISCYLFIVNSKIHVRTAAFERLTMVPPIKHVQGRIAAAFQTSVVVNGSHVWWHQQTQRAVTVTLPVNVIGDLSCFADHNKMVFLRESRPLNQIKM